jgi:pyruvate,water dikinase
VAVDAVVAKLPPLRRRLFRHFLASTRTYLDLRERASFLFSEDTYQFRRVVLAMGERLVAEGRLEDVDDTFYLYWNELLRLSDGEMPDGEARRTVAARRAQMKADAACEPEETICGDDNELTAPAPRQGAAHLVGIGGSPGTLEGYARIVRDPLSAPGDLGERDILVVPFTDVGWTPLLTGIGGIVAEAGGQLSHTAIVAREYGLPAVVGVRRATQELREGEAITLDGRRGRVYRSHVLAGRDACV